MGEEEERPPVAIEVLEATGQAIRRRR